MRGLRKAEIENRRKLEEKMREKDELSQRELEILKAEQEKEETRLREQMEQERRDHELALRLANECNSQVEEFNSTSSSKMFVVCFSFVFFFSFYSDH